MAILQIKRLADLFYQLSWVITLLTPVGLSCQIELNMALLYTIPHGTSDSLHTFKRPNEDADS